MVRQCTDTALQALAVGNTSSITWWMRQQQFAINFLIQTGFLKPVFCILFKHWMLLLDCEHAGPPVYK